MRNKFLPKTLVVLKEGYNLKQFYNDLIAGIIVGIVALPLSIALAIASGVKPEQGLFTAIIGGLCISLFGGSRVQIGGPTGAFVIIIYNIIQNYGYEGLIVASILAGIILIIFGVLKLGNMIKFIPYPVTIGFTSGIALLIFTSQIKDFLGIKAENVPSEFIEKLIFFKEHIGSINIYAVIIGLSTILISVFWSKKFKKIPGSIIAITLTTIAVHLFNLPIETIGSKFGAVPNMLPSPSLPHISIDLIRKMISPAITIALLAGIESLLSAVVADGMIGTRHNSNMELIGQGIANILSPIFGGIPATGAIARTTVNIKNGARTPFAGIIHSITLLSIMIFLGKLAVLIPMATLAGILIIVSYNMSEIKHFIKMKKAPKSDLLVLLITFLLTVLTDLTIAIQFGVISSSLLFMKRMSDVSESDILKKEFYESDEEFIASGISVRNIPEEIEIFEINGPFFFGAASAFRNNISRVSKNSKIIILRMRNVPAIDITAITALESIIDASKKENIKIIISGLQEQPYNAIKKIKLDKKIPESLICDNINSAIKLAKKELKKMSD